MTYRTVRIGDDVPFSLRNLTDQRPGETEEPVPAATVAWKVLDVKTGDQVATGTGTMDLYDAVAASYRGKLPKTFTATLIEKRKYALVMIPTFDDYEQSFTILFVAEARTEATLHAAA